MTVSTRTGCPSGHGLTVQIVSAIHVQSKLEIGEMSESELALAASRAWPLDQVRALLEWVGEGRALTQTGRVRLADARELVALLGTGDLPEGREAEFNLTSSTELPELSAVVEWAKAARLVRKCKGRLVPVKKNASILDRPLELWVQMLEAFSRLGMALCPPGWAESLLRDDFELAMDAMFVELRRRADGVDVEAACELVWQMITARHLFAPASEQHQRLWRKLCDRDVRCAFGVLERFGALRSDGERIELSELGSWGARRATAGTVARDAVLEVKIVLLGISDPPVWRRLQVPAGLPLERMHLAIQVAMGWEDAHLHAFSDGSFRYSSLDSGLECRDERDMTLGDLLVGAGGCAHYIYDFGDDWRHEIILERTLVGEPDVRYPVCVAGGGACPPEDCGGVWSYMDLRDALADPSHERHEEAVDWLGPRAAAVFDSDRFDVDQVNRTLGAIAPPAPEIRLADRRVLGGARGSSDMEQLAVSYSEDTDRCMRVIEELTEEYERYVEREHAICPGCPVTRSGPFIVYSLLEWKAIYGDGRLGHWTLPHMREYLLEHFPRKISADLQMLRDTPACVRDFVYFMSDRGTLAGEDERVLADAAKDMFDEFLAVNGDRRNWGLAKRTLFGGASLLDQGKKENDDDHTRMAAALPAGVGSQRPAHAGGARSARQRQHKRKAARAARRRNRR